MSKNTRPLTVYVEVPTRRNSHSHPHDHALSANVSSTTFSSSRAITSEFHITLESDLSSVCLFKKNCTMLPNVCANVHVLQKTIDELEGLRASYAHWAEHLKSERARLEHQAEVFDYRMIDEFT